MHSLHANKVQKAGNFPFAAKTSSITNNRYLRYSSLNMDRRDNAQDGELSYEVDDNVHNISTLSSSIEVPEIKPISRVNSRKGKQLYTIWSG